MPSLHRDVPNSTPGQRILLTPPTWGKPSIRWLSFVPFPSRDSDLSSFLTSSLPPPLTPTHLLPSHFLSPTSKKLPSPSRALRQMLARSTLCRGSSQLLARTAPHSHRGLAAAAVSNPFHYTVGESVGIKVVSRDDGGPTTALAVVARGGSRYETAPGLAHGLEKFAFKVHTPPKWSDFDDHHGRSLCVPEFMKLTLQNRLTELKAICPSSPEGNRITRWCPRLYPLPRKYRSPCEISAG